MAALSGMVAPALFLAGVIVITWVEYDFMHELGWSLTDHGDSAWPSGLAQWPHGWAQIVNYAVFGLLLLVFVTGLRGEFRRRRSRRIAGALLTILAVGFLFAAFPEDGPPFGEPQTWAGYLHGVGVIAIVLCSFTSMLATAVALRGDERWRGYSAVSVSAASQRSSSYSFWCSPSRSQQPWASTGTSWSCWAGSS